MLCNIFLFESLYFLWKVDELFPIYRSPKKSDNAAKSDKNEYNFVILNISRTKMLVELIKFGALNLVEDKLSL